MPQTRIEVQSPTTHLDAPCYICRVNEMTVAGQVISTNPAPDSYVPTTTTWCEPGVNMKVYIDALYRLRRRNSMTSNTKEHVLPAIDVDEAGEPDQQKELSRDGELNYITGWGLSFISIGMALSTFLVNLEITIVSTSLVSIANDLDDFGPTSWILIKLAGGLVIWAKLSDLLGRKPIFVASLLIFAAFSGGCGAAQTMTQLYQSISFWDLIAYTNILIRIVCRAFQGIGGGGIYALIMVMLYELVPPPRYPAYAALLTTMVASSFALGPVFGGLILRGASWRWVFLLNVPASAIATGIILFAVPRDFPNQGRSRSQSPKPGLAAADFTGAILMVSTLALLIVAFEEAASNLSWTIPTFIGPLCAAVITLAAFMISQWYASRLSSVVEPVLPWHFCQSKLIVGLSLSSFMTGAVSITCIIQIPIRYQTAVGGTPLQAGIKLIPLALSLVFLSRGSPSNPDWRGLNGIEVVIGLGTGCNIGTAALLTPWTVEKRDIGQQKPSMTSLKTWKRL
ncbi:drug resistance transporter [Histoplasma capsulatum G186AR]|uniref:Drug resistance transporter n=1 Tax=Ajellomyces capsulatus (strain G186AR / H82 / ATCC MYA-2454 / RMSCC 2432) TaxID=447093 RepID=C0NSE0_AJECG|nr:drug resistance transporter [Histoplasma capsulatum G186AR]EEH05806.1 drug resistance transporter [Histoplasma capsulatum G186AR]